MSLNMQSVILAGNLTRDPETREVGSSSVASFGLAVNRKWKDKAGDIKEEVLFIDVETWGRTAEIAAQYCQKGKNVMVEGRLKLDQWEKDGKKCSRIKLVADRLHLLGDGKGQGGGDGSADHGNADNRAIAHRPATVATTTAPIDEPPF